MEYIKYNNNPELKISRIGYGCGPLGNHGWAGLDMMDLIKVECAMVQVSTSTQGTQSFDLPLNLRKQRGADKARKDSYSALILGNWMLNVYYDMTDDKIETNQGTFTPMFID